METVWVFDGNNSHFPSGIFRNKDTAIEYIKKYKLSGTLTEYPLGISVYDWLIQEGRWHPKKPHESTPEFIGRFTDARQDHYHFENGNDNDDESEES